MSDAAATGRPDADQRGRRTVLFRPVDEFLAALGGLGGVGDQRFEPFLAGPLEPRCRFFESSTGEYRPGPQVGHDCEATGVEAPVMGTTQRHDAVGRVTTTKAPGHGVRGVDRLPSAHQTAEARDLAPLCGGCGDPRDRNHGSWPCWAGPRRGLARKDHGRIGDEGGGVRPLLDGSGIVAPPGGWPGWLLGRGGEVCRSCGGRSRCRDLKDLPHGRRPGRPGPCRSLARGTQPYRRAQRRVRPLVRYTLE